jgi:putative NADPH-quinone reductase
MRVLLVYCHPRPDSFCAALRDNAVAALQGVGHHVEIRDLYAEAFAPVMTAEQRGGYYDEAANLRGLEEHAAALRGAEALLLVYPTWWFGMPAMLKGWLDRVWVPGVAFRLGGPAVLRPLLTNIRQIGVITAYGSPRWLLCWQGWPDWRIVRRGLRPLCARHCQLDWLSIASMDTCTATERARFLVKVRARLSRWR